MGNALVISIVLLIISTLIGLFIRNRIWGASNKPNNPFQYGRAWASYVAFIVPISSIHLFIQKNFINALFGFFVSLILFPLLAFVCGFIYGQFKKPASLVSVRNTSYLLFALTFLSFIVGLKSLSDSHMFEFKALASAEYDIGLILASYIGSLVFPVCLLLIATKLYKNSFGLDAKKEQKPQSVIDDDVYYEQALNEINKSHTKSSTWAKALANSNGDNGKATSLYIQYRVEELSKADGLVEAKRGLITSNAISPSNIGVSKYFQTKYVLLSLAILAIPTIFFTYTNTSQQQNWVVYSKGYKGNEPFYVDLNSKSKNGDYIQVTSGYDWTSKMYPMGAFITSTEIFDCQRKAWRTLNTKKYDRVFSAGMGKVIESKDYPFKKTGNIWEDLEGWYSVQSQEEELKKLEYKFLTESKMSESEDASLLRLILYYKAQLALFDLICSK